MILHRRSILVDILTKKGVADSLAELVRMGAPLGNVDPFIRFQYMAQLKAWVGNLSYVDSEFVLNNLS